MAVVPSGYELMVAGRFGGPVYADLLFFSRARRRTYSTDGRGSLRGLGPARVPARPWSHIVPGLFGGAGQADLFFYDSPSGLARFELRTASGAFRRRPLFQFISGFTHVVRGRFGPNEPADRLLLYNSRSGRASFYSVDHANGRLAPLRPVDLEAGWTQIVPGSFGGAVTATDLFLYRPGGSNRGVALFLSTDEIARVRPIGPSSADQRPWTHALPGNFVDGQLTELLLHDRATGATSIHRTDGRGGLRLHADYNFGTRWTHLVTGRFSMSRLAHLALHDASDGQVDLWAYTGSGWSKLQAPPTVRLRLTPSRVDYQDVIENRTQVRAIWETREASSIDLQPGIGPVGPAGSAIIPQPRQTTRYTLTARNEGGTSAVARTVEVEGAPVSQPPIIQPGIQPVELTPIRPEGSTVWAGQVVATVGSARLDALINPSPRLGGFVLRFPKLGFSTDECNRPEAAVTLAPQGETTPEQLEEIFGASEPLLPLPIFACAAGADSLSPLDPRTVLRINARIRPA